MKRQLSIIIVLLITIGCPATLGLGAQYKYDHLHRLTRVTYNNGTQITYTYDEVGNRTRRVSTLMADSSIDGSVNFQDFAIVASRWLEQDCSYPDAWCFGADINWSNTVDFDDLALLSYQWLESIGP